MTSDTICEHRSWRSQCGICTYDWDADPFGFDRPPGYFRAGEGGCTCWPPSAPDFRDEPTRIAGPRGAHGELCAVYRAWQQHPQNPNWTPAPPLDRPADNDGCGMDALLLVAGLLVMVAAAAVACGVVWLGP